MGIVEKEEGLPVFDADNLEIYFANCWSYQNGMEWNILFRPKAQRWDQ